MKISYNWLTRYLSDIPNPEEAAGHLTLAGLEVESMETTGSGFDGIVVGEVLEVKPHPNADRLVICNVDTGDKAPEQIVCGAPNVAAGQKVPVATVGATLPKPLPDGSPFKIRKTKIRGQHSSGMICAEDELALSDDHSGIMVLDSSLKPGTPFSRIAGTQKDTIYEIGLTPNRPDATCHLGVARDLAAAIGAELQKPLDDLPEIKLELEKGTIRIMDTGKCHRYTGILIRGVNIAESPGWLKSLLMSIGLRPVNNVVDITNFVLHELGQPLHAFDYHQLAEGRIEVRSFDRETTFKTLDEVERKVPAGSLFICDGEKPVALAGIMGGINSEISENTSDILIESAWFEPTGIRKTARHLALQTDSSYRFERGVDPNITRLAALRCTGLILELCGGTIEGMSDIHPVKTHSEEITLRHERVNRIMGVTMDEHVVTDILNRLEIDTEQAQPETADATTWRCTVPTFRPDIVSEIDLIEEIARIYDYNNIPDPDRITIANPEPLPFEETFREKVRRAAAGAGLKEIYTNSLLPERLLQPLGGSTVVIPALNPITKDQSLLRPGLLYGFLKSAAYNFNRDIAGVRFFEIGNIFRKSKNGGTWIKGIHETTHLLVGLAGHNHQGHWKDESKAYDYFDLKSLVFSILQQLDIADMVTWRGADIVSEDNVIGTIVKVDSEWRKLVDLETDAFVAELDIGLLQPLAMTKRNKTYRPISRFPLFEFDLALVVDKKVAAGDLVSQMYNVAGDNLKNIEVFDVFEGGSLEKHEKSIAFRLTFQDNSKTLTNKDIDPVIRNILNEFGSRFGAKLRS